MQPDGRAFGLERREIAFAVDARELLVRGRRRLVVLQVAVEPGADQAVADRPQPVGAFRVVRPHVVQQRRRVGDVGGRHGACFELWARRGATVGYGRG